MNIHQRINCLVAFDNLPIISKKSLLQSRLFKVCISFFLNNNSLKETFPLQFQTACQQDQQILNLAYLNLVSQLVILSFKIWIIFIHCCYFFNLTQFIKLYIEGPLNLSFNFCFIYISFFVCVTQLPYDFTFSEFFFNSLETAIPK